MSKITIKQLFTFLTADLNRLIKFNVIPIDIGFSNKAFSSNMKKDMTEYYIKYSTDAGNHSIKDMSDLMEFVIIYCHELAHCLNKHNAYLTDQKAELSAIEGRADHMAGSLATALYIYGFNLTKIMETTFKYNKKDRRNINAFCSLMAKAISKLYIDYYKDNLNSRYPHPTIRVGLNIIGISSFFYRSPQFQLSKDAHLLINYNITKQLDSIFKIDQYEAERRGDLNLDFIDSTLGVHLKIQGDHTEINDIQSSKFQHIFGTRYIKDEKIRDSHKKHLDNQLTAFGKKMGLTELVNE